MTNDVERLMVISNNIMKKYDIQRKDAFELLALVAMFEIKNALYANREELESISFKLEDLYDAVKGEDDQ